MVNIVFFGSSPFSIIVLEKILKAKGYHLSAIVTTPAKPAGRHLKLTPNPLAAHAKMLGLNVQYSTSDIQISPQTIGLVAAYGKIITQSILDKFNGQIYNIHPSLLPKYRGPSPLHQQLLDGLTQTGVTIIQIDSQMDHGPIAAISKDRILVTDTSQTLGDRLFAKGADLFLKLDFNDLNLTVQNESEATYTQKLTRQSGFLPWDEFIKFDYPNMFRAFQPWPGIWTTNPKGERVKLISLNPTIIQTGNKKTLL